MARKKFLYNIGIIGFGRVGGSLYYALQKKGAKVFIYTHNPRASLLNKKNLIYSLSELIEKTDIIFIAVPDDKIENVSKDIISTEIMIKNKIFFHLSGAKDSSSLAEIKKQGGFIASLHPLQTFPKIETNPKIWKNTFCLIEGDKEAILIAKEICKFLSSLPFTLINKDKKIFYHSAAVFASNLLVLLIDISQKLAYESGINERKYKKYFVPLIKKTIENILKKGCKNSLSGPLARKDYETISTQIKNIEKNNPIIAEIYRLFVKYYLENEISSLP